MPRRPLRGSPGVLSLGRAYSPNFIVKYKPNHPPPPPNILSIVEPVETLRYIAAKSPIQGDHLLPQPPSPPNKPPSKNYNRTKINPPHIKKHSHQECFSLSPSSPKYPRSGIWGRWRSRRGQSGTRNRTISEDVMLSNLIFSMFFENYNWQLWLYT